ncbi:pyridoxamine 5'-phosphate oxidase family protein [Kribbella sp. NPDC003505]|uniref:pyridoxamine 5'-phosphate oxidase family protein n=1 Tax=Kribbella sp. NPDC003505 TaxID=3154448 RepID=UPI00339EFD75
MATRPIDVNQGRGISMPGRLSRTERQQFLAEAHVGILSVAAVNGQPPLTTPVWYHYAPGGNLTFFTGTQGRPAQKVPLLEKAGQFSFCVQRPEYPYKYVTVECAVVNTERPPTVEAVLAITRRYLPPDAALGFAEAEVANPARTFVLFTGRPEHWNSMSFE